MQTVQTDTDADRIMTIWIDVPDKGVNSVSPQVLADLGEAVAMAEKEMPKAVVFASAKARSFIMGADLFSVRTMDRQQTEQYLIDGQNLFDRIERLAMPTVAAINGDCLGGGMELSLACTYRVAADVPSISIGLPEVKLGILPAWGGTHRLPRRIGLVRALPMMLGGKTLSPRKAQKAGLIDEVVRPEALSSAARRLVTSHLKQGPPPMMQRAASSLSPVRNRILAKARQETLALTRGNYPAPLKVIDVVRIGYERGQAAELEAERRALLELMDTEACHGLMRVFFLRQGSKKWIASQVSAKPREVKYAAVIGGGTMGAGIVHAMAKAGIQVRLIEVDAKAAAAAMKRIGRMLKDDVIGGRMTALDARHALNRVAPTTDWSGLRLADVVIEAAVEKMDAKREIFAKLDKLTRPDAVLATNTSSLSVTEMAETTAHPERVVGLHFFNPVPKMPLLEVVRTARSSDQALSTAAALGARLGKTAILVKDAPGFLVNRILIPYMAEALVMGMEGMPIPSIDSALLDWGMPMGPFELTDEVGLDVAAHVVRSLAEQTGSSRPMPAALETALQRGWLGKKSGRGFYIHAKKKKAAAGGLALNEELAGMLAGKAGTSMTTSAGVDLAAKEAIQSRLVLPMVNEAAKLLEEGVVDSTDAVDLAMVLGTGLAPFRGGLVKFADSIGIDKIVVKLDELAAKHGPRFAPAPLLRRLAEAHRMMSEFAELEKAAPTEPVVT